jgi:hypothetical protein
VPSAGTVPKAPAGSAAAAGAGPLPAMPRETPSATAIQPIRVLAVVSKTSLLFLEELPTLPAGPSVGRCCGVSATRSRPLGRRERLNTPSARPGQGQLAEFPATPPPAVLRPAETADFGLRVLTGRDILANSSARRYCGHNQRAARGRMRAGPARTDTVRELKCAVSPPENVPLRDAHGITHRRKVILCAATSPR